jgi:hypothetical protein
MFKVSVAFTLFSTLAFTTANAPTFQLWRDLPTADLLAPSEPVTTASTDYVAGALFAFNSLNQELSEDDALDRFEVDELNLPKLNVELPELFDWSDVENTYFAQETPTLSGGSSFALDHYGVTAFRSPRVGGAVGHGNGGSRAGYSASATEQPGQSAGKGSGTTEPTGSPDPVQEDVAAPVGASPNQDQFANNDPPADPIDQIAQLPTDIPTTDTVIVAQPPIVSQDPVQVPAPGALGLFALGLAGLRLAGRKKNGRG